MLKKYSLRVKIMGLVTAMFLIPYILNFFGLAASISIRYSINREMGLSIYSGSCVLSEGLYAKRVIPTASGKGVLEEERFLRVRLYFRNNIRGWNFFRFGYGKHPVVDIKEVGFPWHLLILIPGSLTWLLHRRDKQKVFLLEKTLEKPEIEETPEC